MMKLRTTEPERALLQRIASSLGRDTLSAALTDLEELVEELAAWDWLRANADAATWQALPCLPGKISARAIAAKLGRAA